MTKYDLLCLPGVTPPGCGAVTVSGELDDGHERGDRIKIRCPRCGRYRRHEVVGRLRALSTAEGSA